jgi:O-antigen/teichoic acid export membrane protein
LYSPQFQDSGRVLMILVIAVIFRSASWVYGTMIMATRNSRVLAASDLATNLLLLACTRHVLDNSASLEALSWAFVLPNFLYLVFVVEFV